MDTSHGIRQGIQALSDATGWSQEEVWIKGVTSVVVMTVLGVLRAVEFVAEIVAEVKLRDE